MEDIHRYYTDKLAAERLKRCYEIAPQRIRQYLDAEIAHVLKKIRPGSRILELGCGYGRILSILSSIGGEVFGIDTSLPSLFLAKENLKNFPNCLVIEMDAAKLAFKDKTFDYVICIQNGISTFHVNQKELIKESLRALKPGGICLFSSYSDKIWPRRLEWFRLQSEEGLLGEIDYEKSHNGVIICKDGFRATTVRPQQFITLTSGLNAHIKITEVDESSIFCEISPR